jgi:cyclic-di-GMP-binding protein
MAQQNSFDVSTGADLQEVDNAINQARKEVATRYDFKGTDCTIAFDPKAGKFTLEADDEYRLTALFDVLQTRLIRRQVPVRNLKPGAVQDATRGRARQEIDWPRASRRTRRSRS